MNFKDFSGQVFRYLLRTPRNSFQSVSPGRGFFTSKASMVLNADWNFRRYFEYLRNVLSNLSEPGNEDGMAIERMLSQVTFRGAGNADVYFDRYDSHGNLYDGGNFSNKQFYLSKTLASQVIFFKRREGEYQFKIWIEIKVTLLKHDKITGQDTVRCMCKLHFEPLNVDSDEY